MKDQRIPRIKTRKRDMSKQTLPGRRQCRLDEETKGNAATLWPLSTIIIVDRCKLLLLCFVKPSQENDLV